MAKLLANLGHYLAVAIFGSKPTILPQSINVEFVTTDEMEEILKLFPNPIQMMQTVQNQTKLKGTKDDGLVEPNIRMEYTMGRRAPNDELIGYDSGAVAWAKPQDVYFVFLYPENGEKEYIISYVNIVVNQSSSTGRAYIVDGGIGYQYITIVIEAHNTLKFQREANIYGYI